MEFSTVWFPVAGDLFLPWGPVLFLLVNVMFEYSIAVREHRLNISQDIVDFSTTSLVNCCTYRPDKAEHEPLFDVE